MIIKISDNKDGWSYFECSTFHFRHAEMNQVPITGEEYNFLCRKEHVSEVKIFRLEKNRILLATIITNQVVYVLNDNGKTIDKI